MTDNLPILYRNVMDGLPSDLARDAFLWATERPGEDRMCYRAEAFAREVDQLVGTLGPLHKAGFQGLRAQKPELFLGVDELAVASDLMGFILTRHANWRFGGNVKPTYAVAA
jgi:hypothetical protein